MKKLLFVIPTLRMGGAEKALVSLLKALDYERFSVDLLLFESGGILQKELPENVNVMEADPITRGMILEMRYHLGNVIKNGAIRAAFSRIKISIISKANARRDKVPAFTWKMVESYIPKLEKHYDIAVGGLEGYTDFYVIDKVDADRKIGWVHTDLSKRILPAGEIELYNRFDALVTISDVCKAAIAKHIPESADKTHIIENIVLPQEVLKKANDPVEPAWDKNRIHIVTVGRIEHAKGIDIGAMACEILEKRGVPVCWHVYGDGSLKNEMLQYAQAHNLSDSYILEGLAANPYPFMKAADVLVQPSRFEGKSIVLDEAKILGKAIVATNYPSVFDQITDEVTGIVTGMEPEAVANGIERVINDDTLRKKLERNCLNEQNSSIKALNTFYDLLEP